MIRQCFVAGKAYTVRVGDLDDPRIFEMREKIAKGTSSHPRRLLFWHNVITIMRSSLADLAGAGEPILFFPRNSGLEHAKGAAWPLQHLWLGTVGCEVLP
jgi:hypothetical protein